MADPTYVLPEIPVYCESIRALKDSDPACASTVFNPLVALLLENIHFTKKKLDELQRVLNKGEFDCGGFDDGVTVEIHDGMAYTHPIMLVDGNENGEADTSETLEEHMKNPLAHRNLNIDGNGS